MLWPKPWPQKAGCTGSFGLSVTVPEGCSPDWQVPGRAAIPCPPGSSRRCRGCRVRMDTLQVYGITCTPCTRCQPNVQAPRAPLGGRGPRVLYRRAVWLLLQHGGAPGVLLRDGVSPSRSARQGPTCMGAPSQASPVWVLPARRCRMARGNQDDSPAPSAPQKNSWDLPDPAAAGSCRVSPTQLSPSRCQNPSPFPTACLAPGVKRSRCRAGPAETLALTAACPRSRSCAAARADVHPGHRDCRPSQHSSL